MADWWAGYIGKKAPKYGLDPRAVLSVAAMEGLSGGVGDAGTSFGPFQLHIGGANPYSDPARARSFAESRKGIDYALRKMAESGAKGQRGQAAINSIVRRFERPADPDKEVAGALARYGSTTVPRALAAPAVAAAPARKYKSGSQVNFFDEKGVFRPPKYKFKGGTDATKLAQGLLSGMSAEHALSEATVPWEMVEQIPRMPKPVAQVKAAKYGGTVEDAGPSDHPNPKVAQALAVAKQQIGKPYVFGAATPGVGFDCSGLIEYAYEQAGIKTPGRLTTGPMSKMGAKVPWKNIQPGDWIVKDSGGTGHVVMYTGNGQVIAAPHTGEVVQYQPLSRFASDRRYAVRRWHGEE